MVLGFRQYLAAQNRKIMRDEESRGPNEKRTILFTL